MADMPSASPRTAADALSRVVGAGELHAAVLALLLPPGSQRAVRAWAVETGSIAAAEALRAHAAQLDGPSRLPWFEVLVSRMRAQPLAAREGLLEATRRVMSARGALRPIDRLHWLAMRQRLGGGSASDVRRPASADLSRLPQSDVSAIAAYSAFLARIVPVDAAADAGVDRVVDVVVDVVVDAVFDAALDSSPDAPVEGLAEPHPEKPVDAAVVVTPGTAWYDAVMSPWRAHATVPACRSPDTDGLVHALQELQALPWMQRPMLLREWVGRALEHSRHGRLSNDAADALRLSGALLDSPLTPALDEHYARGLALPREIASNGRSG